MTIDAIGSSDSERQALQSSELPVLLGNAGEAVGDIRKRLRQAGFATDDVPADFFGNSTLAAVLRFQATEGLPETGEVDRPTWSALIEASRQLGDRPLYLRQPMLRGQDVADLQHMLGKLGFDAGRADGFFGEQTAKAIVSFQQNTGLGDDGICGPATTKMLGQVVTRSGDESVATLREKERLRQLPPTVAGRKIVIGEAGGLGALSEAIHKMLRRKGALGSVLHHPDLSQQAEHANKISAELYIGLELQSQPVCTASYFSSDRYTSPGGKRCAEIAISLLSEVVDVEIAESVGMRLPILQKTQMPAIWIRLGPGAMVVKNTANIAATITQCVHLWVAQPLEA